MSECFKTERNLKAPYPLQEFSADFCSAHIYVCILFFSFEETYIYKRTLVRVTERCDCLLDERFNR